MFIMLHKPVCHMKSCLTHLSLLPVWGILQTWISLGVCTIFESRPGENNIIDDEKLNMTWQFALAPQKDKMYEVPPNPKLSLMIYDNTTTVCIGETTRISSVGLVLSWIMRQICPWAQVSCISTNKWEKKSQK